MITDDSLGLCINLHVLAAMNHEFLFLLGVVNLSGTGKAVVHILPVRGLSTSRTSGCTGHYSSSILLDIIQQI